VRVCNDEDKKVFSRILPVCLPYLVSFSSVFGLLILVVQRSMKQMPKRPEESLQMSSLILPQDFLLASILAHAPHDLEVGLIDDRFGRKSCHFTIPIGMTGSTSICFFRN